MNVLGAGRGPSLLGDVTVSLDEMQYLLGTLELDDLPVVLDTIGRYDTVAAHDHAVKAAASSLAQRDLLVDGQIVTELADRLRALNYPHWAVAVRLVIEGHTSRMCLAQGDQLVTVALRGPESYVLSEADTDLAGPILAALGSAPALELTGLNAPTEQILPILGIIDDSPAMAAGLAEVGHPPRDAGTIAAAMTRLESLAEIVGVIYGEGTRETSPHRIAVFNTSSGRFITTSSPSDDGQEWISFSSGSTARLRTAINELIDSLPMRAEFPPVLR